MAKIIAVCGKGGAGKTTTTAIIAKLLLNQPFRVLLIDADTAGGLTLALKITPKKTIEQVQKQIINELRKNADKRELAYGIDYFLLSCLSEKSNLAFLAIGRPEDEGCYCRVNSLLKEAIEKLADKFDLVIIDAEAGIEQINRRVMSSVDYLLIVSDPSVKGLFVASAIEKTARKIQPKIKAGLIINRTSPSTELNELKNYAELNILGTVPEDPTIRKFDTKNLSFLDLPPCPALTSLAQIIQKENIISL